MSKVVECGIVDKQVMWDKAREFCCDDCLEARGCNAPCQLLRNKVKEYERGIKREQILEGERV